MSFPVGWDKRQLSRDGPPLEGLPLVGRRSHSLAGPTLLSADPQVFSALRFVQPRPFVINAGNTQMPVFRLSSRNWTPCRWTRCLTGLAEFRFLSVLALV